MTMKRSMGAYPPQRDDWMPVYQNGDATVKNGPHHPAHVAAAGGAEDGVAAVAAPWRGCGVPMMVLRRYRPCAVAVIAVALIVGPGRSQQTAQVSTGSARSNQPATAAGPEPPGEITAGAVTATTAAAPGAPLTTGPAV